MSIPPKVWAAAERGSWLRLVPRYVRAAEAEAAAARPRAAWSSSTISLASASSAEGGAPICTERAVMASAVSAMTSAHATRTAFHTQRETEG